MALRILFVMLGRKDFRSGGYIFNFRMVEHLRTIGHDVGIIHYRTVPAGLADRRLSASRYILQRIRSSRPDLLIVGKSYPYMLLPRIFAMSGRMPVLYLMHHLEWRDTENRFRSLLYRKYVRWLLGAADHVWANSASTRSGIIDLGIESDRIRVVYPGFDRENIPLPDRAGRDGPVRLLCAGSISPRKAQYDLVSACALLEGADFTLTLAGSLTSDPEYALKVRDLAEGSGIAGSITFAGNLHREALIEAYLEADILVHPARWEAFGISIVEAMWFGLPVIASDVGGIPELVQDGVNGILIPRGNHVSLADAIGRLMADRRTRLRMGAESRRLAEGLNDWTVAETEFAELVEYAADAGS